MHWVGERRMGGEVRAEALENLSLIHISVVVSSCREMLG